MDQESLRKLRFDRRLIGRRGWVSEQQLQKDLEALPDVSDKQMPPEPADGEEAAASDGEPT